MAKTPVPLNPEQHKNTRIKQTGTLEHVKDSHMAPVFVYEFVNAALDYPILFVKDPNREETEFRSIVMWGLESGSNLFIKNDKWDGGFVPSALNCHPFTAHVKEERVFIGLFEDSDLVNEEEGERIFNDDGKESEWFGKTLEYMKRVLEHENISVQFCKELEKLDILVPQALNYTVDGQEKKVDGFFVIDAKKLNELSDETFLDMRKKGMLDAIYAHLASLANINKLLKRKVEK